MARGGYRPGAGRPKSAKTPAALAREKAPADVKRAARKSGLSPLDYMLAVMNDTEADDARRDRMAVVAAGYVHAKPSDAPKGKKEEAADASRTAGAGTDWGSDLGAPSSALN
jgi:hypothetical protein